jgi:hypothetical protein
VGWVWIIVVNGLLALGGYWAARRVFRQPAGVARTLAAAVLAWTWATVGLQTLGSLGFLAQVPLLAWTLCGIALTAVMATLSRRPGDHQASSELADPHAITASRAKERAHWSGAAIVALGLAFWASLVLGVPSALLPVKVVSDGPIYHLYFAARWWKAGQLFLIATPFGETAATYFPAGGDLWFTWLMVLLGGDRLARVGQAPFLLMSAIAAYGLARRLQVKPSAALIATTWFVTCLPFLAYSFEANVDTIFIAGYLTSAFFLLRYALGDEGTSSLALAALAAGCAWGTKPTATVFLPVLLAFGAVAIVWSRRPTHQKLGHLALLALCPLSTAGYWFGSGLLLSGNPLYPLHVSAFGKVIFRGWYEPSAMRQSQFFIPVEDWRSFNDIMCTILDPRLVPFWMAALFGAWAIGERRSGKRWVWVCAILGLLNVALYWLVIPYRTQQRFMLQALGLWVVPLGRLLDRSRWLRLAAVSLLAIHLLTPQQWPLASGSSPFWHLSEKFPRIPIAPIKFPTNWNQLSHSLSRGPDRTYLITSLLLAAACTATSWAWSRAINQPRLRRWVQASAASAALIGGFFWPLHSAAKSGLVRFPQFPEYLRGWNTLDSQIGKSGARIAYAGTNLPFYLMGPDFRNDVRYVNINAHPGWLLHAYHREAMKRGEGPWPSPRPGWDRLEADYDAWLDNLRNEGIQVLVVARAKPEDGLFNIADPQQFPIERQWAETHPESFTPRYGVAEQDPEFRFYRVHPRPRRKEIRDGLRRETTLIEIERPSV